MCLARLRHEVIALCYEQQDVYIAQYADRTNSKGRHGRLAAAFEQLHARGDCSAVRERREPILLLIILYSSFWLAAKKLFKSLHSHYFLDNTTMKWFGGSKANG